METKEWVKQKLKQFDSKFEKEVLGLKERIPHYAKSGRYVQDMAREDITWWTNGFLGGILWQLFSLTNNPLYKTRAVKLEEQLDQGFQLFNGLHHDVGFMWLHTSVAHTRRLANPESVKRGLHAATLLAGRYNPTGEYIRSWNGENQTWVIIDSLMNLPLLHWASEETGDERFSAIAKIHAEKVLTSHLRGDGSANHIVIFDEQGNLKETPAGQGYQSGSSWSRGQSWAIYGFALSYLYTKDVKFLNAAKQVAHYFMTNVSKTEYIPVVDFRGPVQPLKYDTSAGLCAACGLLEISKHVEEEEKNLYLDFAATMVKSIEKMAADWDEHQEGIIGYGTCEYNKEETTHVSLIYSDYFFLEALMRLNQTYMNMW